VYEDRLGSSLLDFDALHQYLLKNKIDRMEKNVFIGAEEKLPVRLVIALVPQSVYDSRIRKRNNKNKNIGKTRKSKSKSGKYTISDKSKIRAHFNLYISNIPAQELSIESICNLYSARWQIERMFKVWKSILKIHCIGKMNYHRLMTTLYMSLLWMVVHWEIISSYGNYLYQQQHRLLSVYKSMNTLKTYSQYIRLLFRMNKKKLGKMLRTLLDVLSERHWLEQVKNKRSYQEIVGLIFCQSKEYA
jgi:transcription termination factor NusB